jgi:tetratricopeptide (TPR) repeat protein
MRLILAVGAPIVFVIFLEAILRVCGVGHSASFFLPFRTAGGESRIQNDRFGWRFFGREMARQPFPCAFAARKPPGTIRIFVLGESAAYGDPQPEYGLSRMLEALLGGRYPRLKFEVVNVAMTAINSHVILPIASDCAREEGDVWVVYMGNNEVVGPFGAGTVFGSRSAGLGLIRASLALKTLRSGQCLEDMASRVGRRRDSPREWGGMEMFLNHQLRQDAPQLRRVYWNFEENLKELLALGSRHGVKIVVGTVANNLGDCAPFASLHPADLEPSARVRWEEQYQKGILAQRSGNWSEAVAYFRDASRIDDSFANLQFAWGRCCLELDDPAGALAHLTRARDEDALRFRADSRINDIIRKAAAGRKAEGIGLADSEQMLSRRSPSGIIGNELLYEHVHLNFEGNYFLALTFAEQIAELLPGVSPLADQTRPDWPTQAQCARRLGWTDWNRYEAESSILSRLTDPPFATQANHREQYERLKTHLGQLRATTTPPGLRQAQQHYQDAMAQSPGDWVLNKELARVREKLGDLSGAADCWREVVKALPHYTEAWQALGRVFAEQKQDSQARAAFDTALRLDPDSATTLTALAEIFSREGRHHEAIRYYERTLALKPYWGPAQWGLGKSLEAIGRPEEAKPHFQRALHDRLYTPAALKGLARLCFEKGWLNEACTNFIDALKLDPLDAATEVNLGLTLALLHRNLEAQRHYAEATRIDPNLAEAHVRLGVELGRMGDDPAALEHFEQAVRLKPDLLEARLNLGIALLKQGRQTDALAEFNEVLQRDPNNQVALKNLQKLDQK